MKIRMRRLKEIISTYRKTKRSSTIVYIVLRIFVILCMVDQIVRGDLNSAFLCFLALILMTLPIVVQRRFKIELPNVLEILILLFIVSAVVLGEIFNFYGNIPHFDTILHTINGFLCAGIGFALVDLLNNNSKQIKLSPLYVAIVAFCFSMTIGVCWEFFEYRMDSRLNKDMQKSILITEFSTVSLHPEGKNRPVIVKNIDKTVLYDADGNELAIIDGGYLDMGINDTMKDLIVNLVGAATFSVLGYFYTINRDNQKDKYKFTKYFIPKKLQK